MVSYLCAMGVDLNWADQQYWSILMEVIGEIADVRTPKRKEKVTSAQITKYIRD